MRPRRSSALFLITSGFTLIELLVAAMLVSVLMGAVMWVVGAGKTTWQASITRSAARQDLQTAMRRIELDLRDSSAALVTGATEGSPSAFALLSAFDASGQFSLDPAGRPVWQSCIVYYVPQGTTRLLRRTVPGSFSGPVSMARLLSFCDGTGSLVAQGAAQIVVMPDTAANSVLVTLTMRSLSQHGKIDEQSVTRTIFCRNQG